MKSTTSPAWLRRFVLGLGSAALAMTLTSAGCTKEASSSTASPNQAPDQGVGQAVGQAVDQAVGQAPDQAPVAAKTGAPTQAPAAAATGAAAPDTAAAEAQPMGNNPAGDETYSLKLDTPAKLAKGSEGTVRVNISPKTGWKMNKEFPTKLKVTPPAGITLAKAEQSISDAERFEDAGATFAVKFKADDPGAKSFQAKLKFAVCTDATCTPKTQELAWVVNVE